jgi:hypothetical protein
MASEQHVECKLARMELFPGRLIQNSIKDSQVIAYNPSASIEQNAPVRFIIPGTSQSYISTDMKLYCRWKVTKADGTPIDANANVGVLNYHHAISWNSVDVTLNQVNLSPPNNLAHMVAYLQAVLSYTQDVKARSLQREGWYPDVAGQFTNAANTGFVARKTLIAGSREFESIGRICHPLFNTAAVIPNGVEIVITLHRSPDSYVILDTTAPAAVADAQEQYKLHLLDAVLYVTRILPTEEQALQDNMDFDKNKPSQIILPKIDVKSLTVPANVNTKSFHSLYTGLLPRRVVCCLLPNVTSAYTTNGLELRHFNINSISLVIGSRRYPAKDLKLDFTNKRYMRAYDQLFDALNLSGNAADIGINYNDYGNGYTIFAWDLTPSQCSSSSEHYDNPSEGDLSLEVSFAAANNATISVIMCSEFTQIIEIDKYRNIKIIDDA